MFKYFFLFLFLTAQTAYGVIVEHDTITSIHSHLDAKDQGPQTLVVFEIDNTIAEMAGTECASDQWFFACVNLYMNHRFDYWTSVRRVIIDYQKLQERLSLALIEPEFLMVMQQLRNMGVRMIALTSRPVSLLNRTTQQLKEIGIEFLDFGSHAIEGHLKDAYRLQNGIIAAGLLGNNKGEVLFEVLKALDYIPETIVYVDCKELQVKNVVHESSKHGIAKIVGIRYSRLDEKIKRYYRSLITNSKLICKRES
jgi:hypothetical protein